MAPSPENDNTPKAPDKGDKSKADKHNNAEGSKEKNKDIKTLNNLNDCELKDLLDEAITYKNPKDREGKSTLFKELLSQAEESERNARAASASGSEQVRYCNTSAKRSKHRRKPNSISENVMHGGSLDNLAKEELFEVSHHLIRHKRTVSARMKEGGSLPSNVNAGSLASYDPNFLEEARRRRAAASLGPPEPMEVDDVDMETASLLAHDSVAENYDGALIASHSPNENAASVVQPKYTTKATLQVNVDDAVHFNELEPVVEKRPYELEQISAKVVQSRYSVYIPNYGPLTETVKKVDENGNALHQNTTSKNKKKKVQSDKNVVSCVAAEKVEGHRSDIINDVEKLLEFIGEDKPQTGAPNRTNAHRSNKLHKHTSEEGQRSKKQRAHSSKGKENRSEMKKSNSLGEISTAKLDDFAFDSANVVEEVVLRTKNEEKPRERRSWGNAEHEEFFRGPSNDLESASSDFHVVTKKKKTKKRRSSVSGSRRKGSAVASAGVNSSKSDGDRASSPKPRRKSACSVPHSERSNDSSDIDSVHSLPVDAGQHGGDSSYNEDAPVSYADIAKNSERKSLEGSKKSLESRTASVEVEVVEVKQNQQQQQVPSVQKAPPPDVHNTRSFPAIHASTGGNNKSERVVPSKGNNAKGGSGANKLQQGKQQNMVQSNNAANARVQSNVPMSQANDISILQDTIQYTAQIVPPLQIPDVQTIEKMHFLNQPGAHMPAHLQQHVLPPHHIQILPPHHHHQHPQVTNHHPPLPVIQMPEMFANGRMPVYTASISHTPHVTYGKSAYEGACVAYVEPAYVEEAGKATDVIVPKVDNENARAPNNNKEDEKPGRSKARPSRGPSNPPPTDTVIANSDASGSRPVPKEAGQREDACASICDNRTSANECAGSDDSSVSRPPVVILSGRSNREVSGLVFGFDVNEQLLSEDICESFVQRYRPPQNYTATSHNHDKIVNFIGSAWEEVKKSEALGKAQYYSDTL